MRNILDVIARIEDQVPDPNKMLESANAARNILLSLKHLKLSLAYSAPEMTTLWWNELAEIINKYISPEYENLVPWQKEVVDIFTGKK